ncbi:membrane protein [Hyphomicrobium nitrativorans NL23]|uniref:Membrane protein n=1 Tax=Hyphomicrobium nitrativorans NL23 TaxID=1029756 RepID=V5SHX4_9HYPH|nr:ceramidase domain-containing protein [Hyphomicrobium nitrativorans]AHB49650.1 membrane protein [Hyphomicrobium nitrativorans NL23]
MSLSQQIFIYCERGQDPAFWAEPMNALTNGAFIVAAAVATRDYWAAPPERRHTSAALLILLTYTIGAGSFLFHTYATRWAALADTIPIALFMLAYFGFVLRRFLGLHWLVAVAGVAAFYATLWYSGTIECRYDTLLPITSRTGARCFNGTLGYAPAFFALIGAAALLAALRHPAWRLIGLAGVVFLASMTFRTLDLELCNRIRLGDLVVGTHFLWHVLNALTLYLLLRAAIRYGSSGARLNGPA